MTRSFMPVTRGTTWLILALAASSVYPAQLYSVRDLGVVTDLPGRTESRPNGINQGGAIAGVNVTNGAYRAWLYGGAWTNLGTLGGNESLASGLNESNRVVGYSANASGVSRGFIWTPGGTDGVAGNPQMKELGTFGGTESAAFGINASGQIAGYAQTANRDHAFQYANGVMTDLGGLLPNGLPNSYAFGINDAGRVAGTAYSGNFGSWEAFFYDGASMTRLGTFGAADSSALAINNSDCIVGYYSSSGGLDRAFRYLGGVMTDLGTLGGDYSYANAVNNSNVIVGGSFVNTSNTVFHAFIWVLNSMSDLNTQLDATGAGWTLVEARGINDSGQIVGTGTRGGATHGFLLIPGLGPQIPQITQQPTNLTVASSSNATFTVAATPAGVFYQWFKGIPPNGVSITNATNNVLAFANVSGAFAGSYYVVVTNGAGSATSSVATLTVTDTTPPVISWLPNLTNYAAPGLCAAVVTWPNPTATDNCDGVVPVTCMPTNGSTFPRGVTTVTCQAVDSSRNANTCAFTVTVLDRQAPVLSGCSGNLTNYAAVGASTAVVSWPAPTATDNCDGVVLVTCAPTNGSAFARGVTTVTCQAADSSRNTNTCAFTVTVLSVQAPVITGVRLDGTNLVISFTTLASLPYAVETTPRLPSSGWIGVITNIAGNGSIITVTNSFSGARSNRFYRVALLGP